MQVARCIQSSGLAGLPVRKNVKKMNLLAAELRGIES